MITEVCQRWRGRRLVHRPAGELIDPRQYEVVKLDGKGSDNVVAAFVAAHHYARRLPPTKERILLYRGVQLVGVAVFTVSTQAKSLDVLPCPRVEAVELGRLVLLDSVPGNGESWFVSRALDLVRREGYAGVLSFSDPVPRRTSLGELVMPGHRGIVYQALSSVYTGRGTARTLWLLPDGTVFSDRTMQKLRKKERGWRGAVDLLVEAGARSPVGDDLGPWARAALRAIGRRFRHPGNHRYLFPLDRACRRALTAHLEGRGLKPLPYPRVIDAEPIARAA